MRGFGAGWASERDRPLVLHRLAEVKAGGQRTACGCPLTARLMAVEADESVTCLRCLAVARKLARAARWQDFKERQRALRPTLGPHE